MIKKLQWYNLPLTANENFEDVQEQIDAIEGSAIEPATTIAAIPATTNITTVPGVFADVTSIQTYLSGTNVIPNIESRFDNLEAKVNELISKLKISGAIAQ